MELLLTFVIFFGVMATVAWLGIRVWVRPKAAIERVAA